jgi:isatin hydrolase
MANDSPAQWLAAIKATTELVDLTLTLDENMPVSWCGHVPFKASIWSWYQQSVSPAAQVPASFPYQTRWMVIDEHCGTHFDAPPHFIPPSSSGLPMAGPWGDIYGDKAPLQQLCGPAAVIDVTALDGQASAGQSPFIEARHIKAWESSHGELCPGDIVLFHTGWDRRFKPFPECTDYLATVLAGQSTGWPAPSPEAAAYLYEKGIMCFGTDGASMGAAHDGAPLHHFALSRGMLLVEALTNLDKLPPRGAFFLFLPLKISRSTGGPGRAIAFSPRLAV